MSQAVVHPPLDRMTADEMAVALTDPMFRLANLYYIKTKTADDSDEDSDGVVVKFKPNRAQRRLLERLHYKNLILKARQLGFCVDPATRVLTADLRWIPIADLQPGQEVVAVDEHPPGGKGAARKMRTATVEAVAKVYRKAYRITLDDGRTVTCTAQHPWLTRKAATDAQWRSIDGTGNEVVGRIKVGTKIRWVTKPWDGARTFDDGWMGGMLDGEGSMALAASSGAEINVSQLQGPAFARMEMYLAQRGYNYRTEEDGAERKTKFGKTPVHKLCISRMDEMFRLLGETRPIRFLGRHFWEGKELPGKRNGGIGWATVTAIEELGEQTMIDLQTSTGTYIAEGFVSHNTTLIQILFLDFAFFTPNLNIGVIAHTDDAAKKIFKKIKFAYDRLPQVLRDANPTTSNSVHELTLKNGSTISVGTSMRGDTIHYLHVSEYGKICAKFPDRAEEIITGSFPAVPETGMIFIESTSEGRDGDFYKKATRAEALHNEGVKLSPMQFRFHFFPWHEAIEYTMDPAGIIISPKEHEYFDQLEAKIGRTIDAGQRAWWVGKRDEAFGGQDERMFQEYPSTPAEAFQQSTEGTYYPQQIAKARKEGRFTTVPFTPGVVVNTFWDIGSGDGTAIWFHQKVGLRHHFIKFIEGWGESYSYFVKEMQKTGWVWGRHFLPHDGAHERQGEVSNDSPKTQLENLGLRNLIIVPRISELQHGINAVRDKFSLCLFDQEQCKEGIVHLELYKKKWNTQTQTWTDQPLKDIHTEGADSFRQWAQGWEDFTAQARPKRSLRNWRTT